MSDFHEPAGGYGRIWESMYEGSLAGTGPEVFCLMPYVIAKMRMNKGRATVLLNPKVLAPIFGGIADQAFVERGIEKLCAPDPDTKNGKDQEGRRLIRLDGHLYEVVNGMHYMQIRNKERHADAQARYRNRQKKAKKPEPLPGEPAALRSDAPDAAERIGAELDANREERKRQREAAEKVRAESEARAEAAALAADVPEVEAQAGEPVEPAEPEDEQLYQQSPE